MIRLNRRALLLLALLTLSEVILFSESVSHYFQGDSLYWLAERYTSLPQVAAAFQGVDAYGYFRPLSHPLIPSLLYPLFGLDPLGYHWAVLLVFLGTVWMVFRFFQELTGGDWEAFLATFLFGIHPVNAFVTFDFAFEPELLYGLFYLLSAFCFLRRLNTGETRWSWLSAGFFLASLLSKEAAVTLPANLFWLALLPAPSNPPRAPGVQKRFPDALKSTLPHWLLLAGYLSYLAFGLRGGRLLLGAASAGEGVAGVVSTVWSNLRLASLWAMNLPAGWESGWRHLPAGLEWFLALFAVVVVGGLLDSLFRPGPSGKRLVQVGFLWFLTALAPMLVFTNFKSYYLYVPLIGLSLATGRILVSLWRSVAARSTSVANSVLGTTAILLWLSCRLIASGDIAHHPLLGAGAAISRAVARDIQRIRPTLPRGATILVLDTAARPLYWHCAGGRLFRLVYHDPALRSLFATVGDRATPQELDRDGFTAVSYQGAGLVDVTERLRSQPDARLGPEVVYSREVRDLIRVRPRQVLRGEGRYTLRVDGAGDQEVELQFQVNGGPPGYFKAHLNASGEVSFFVSSDNRPGDYRFMAVRGRDERWTKSDPPGELEVR